MAEERSVGIALEGVSKGFGKVAAVKDVNISIAEGEFFSLLGPSGCGKTTSLRMIAGFEQPDAGRIVLQGEDVTNVRPNRRAVNMVFQHYALFPHMSVYDNVAFGLKVKRIQSSLGTTFVYVTHDQEEALAMSDRIAVMNGGLVEQTGSPREIYERPATAFVADFIGSLNAFDLRIDELIGQNAVMRLGESGRSVVAVGRGHGTGETLRAAVRPERVHIALAGTAEADGGSHLDGTIAGTVFLGMYLQYHVD